MHRPKLIALVLLALLLAFPHTVQAQNDSFDLSDKERQCVCKQLNESGTLPENDQLIYSLICKDALTPPTSSRPSDPPSPPHDLPPPPSREELMRIHDRLMKLSPEEFERALEQQHKEWMSRQERIDAHFKSFLHNLNNSEPLEPSADNEDLWPRILDLLANCSA